MPFKPIKCIGKNVKFTPKNIKKKILVIEIELKVLPKIRGDQRINPKMIPNTAPIDKT